MIYKNAHELIDLIKKKELSSVELLEALLKRVEKSKQSEMSSDDLKDTKFYKNKFKNFCNENYLKDLHNDDLNLLNYILFTKESENFYLSNMKNNMNDIIGLQ